MPRLCQKAPSAKRCIKTGGEGSQHPRASHVRKHRAPKGALRLITVSPAKVPSPSVRKHRAPKGALRPASRSFSPSFLSIRQKAPSAKRCIKTHPCGPWPASTRGQKAPSAKRCIKTDSGVAQSVVEVSQKAPSTPKSRMQFP